MYHPALLLGKAKAGSMTLAQHLLITMGFFGKNGLTNHAAAGAYGFLLSAAPMLLIVSFFLIRAFRTEPGAALALVQEIPFLNFVANGQWPALEFLVYAPAGVSTIISMLSIFWAGRIFAVSMQRGIKIVFTGNKKRNPVQENLVTLAIEFVVLVVMLVAILGSRMALDLYEAAGVFQGAAFMRFVVSLSGSGAFRLVAMFFFLYLVYILIPVNPPRKLAAFWGSVFCSVVYGTATTLMDTLLRQPRYNFIYGALGELVIVLVGVYIFFLCFFLGCQLAAVSNSFDALLFLRLRETRNAQAGDGKALGPRIARAFFYDAGGRLGKYRRSYSKGETVMSKGDTEKDVYFLLEGEVDVLLPSKLGADRSAGVLKAGSFIGEMGYLLSEGRTATIRAKTDVFALALPPALFGEILGHDTELDKSIIENLSRRIKRSNEQISALSESETRD